MPRRAPHRLWRGRRARGARAVDPRTLVGVEAVIDKDRCGAKLANELDADGLIILTDGGGIWQNFGKPDAREMKVVAIFAAFTQSRPIDSFFARMTNCLPGCLFFSASPKLASPEYLLGTKAGKAFPGSMGPKIQAAIDFVMQSNKEDAWAAIGDLRDAGKIFGNEEGTLIKKFSHSNGVVWRERKAVPGGGIKLSKDQHKSG